MVSFVSHFLFANFPKADHFLRDVLQSKAITPRSCENLEGSDATRNQDCSRESQPYQY
jgi:hypothetical protein